MRFCCGQRHYGLCKSPLGIEPHDGHTIEVGPVIIGETYKPGSTPLSDDNDRTPYHYRTLSWKCVCGAELGAPREVHSRIQVKTADYRFCSVAVSWVCQECQAVTLNGPFLEMPCVECVAKEAAQELSD